MKKVIISFLKPVVFILFLAIFSVMLLGCADYTKPPTASHVLAVTLEGDTILIAIDKIRPSMNYSYYPIYSNPYYNNYNYRNYNYQWRYNDNRGSSSTVISKNKSEKPPVSPDITTRPSAEVLLKGKK